MGVYKIDDITALEDFREYFAEIQEVCCINDNIITLKGDQFIVSSEFSSLLDELKQNPKYEPLYFGKDQTENIVSIEKEDDSVILFKNNGKLEKRPLDYFLITSHNISGSEVLSGKNYYQYISTFKKQEEYEKIRRALYKQRSDFYKPSNHIEGFMQRNGVTLFKGLTVDNVSVLSFDIETSGVTHNKDSLVLLISNTFRKDGKIIRKLFSLDAHKNQEEMIEKWCQWVQEINPEILIGHNIYTFDLPYLQFCYRKELFLGRNHKKLKFSERKSKYRKEAGQFIEFHEPKAFGRQIIDTLFLSYKYDQASRKYERYGLKYIIEFEGLEKKDRIKWNFENDKPIEIYKNRNTKEGKKKWENFKIYCNDDSDDSLKLWDLMIPAYFYVCQNLPMQLQTIINTATGRWVNSFLLRSYIQDGKGIPKACAKRKFGGGISFGNAGVYEHIYKVDVASLYPSIIRTKKIYHKTKDPEGNFLKMVEYFTNERLINKKKGKDSKYHKDLSEAQKIFINSAYGLMGTKGLNFNYYDGADLTTETGREFIQKGCEWVWGRRLRKEIERNKDGTPITNEEGVIKEKWHIDYSQELGGKFFTLVNVDTDSFSFSTKKRLKLVTKEQAKKKGIEPIDEFQDLIDEINSLYPDGILWEDDGYFKRGIVIRAKNYIFQRDPVLIKKSGEKEFMKKGTFNSRAREKRLQEFMNDAIMLMLNKKKDQIFHLYNNYAKEILEIEDITDWCKTKTITQKVLNPKTAENEKVLATIKKIHFQEGDKIKIFYLDEDNMELLTHFSGKYYTDKYLEKLYDTLSIFDGVYDVSVFPNYKLKKNRALLD